MWILADLIKKNKMALSLLQKTHGSAATVSLAIYFCPGSLRGSAHTWHIVYVISMFVLFYPEGLLMVLESEPRLKSIGYMDQDL